MNEEEEFEFRARAEAEAAPPKRYGSGAAGMTDVQADNSLLPTGSQEAQDAISPVAGNNFLQNARIGVGKFYTDAMLGARQIAGMATDQEAIDKRTIDAPVADTAGGKVGQFAGALPLAFVPGANTYAGATILGGALGATTPTVGDESRLMNTAGGAAIGAFGKYTGDGLSSWLTNRAAQPFTGWRQATANDALAGTLNAPSLDSAGLKQVSTDMSAAFRGGRNAANVVDMTTQGGSVANIIAHSGGRLNPSGQAEFTNNPSVQNLMLHLRNGSANAEQLGQISSDLYDQASSIMSTKGADKMVGKALFAVRDEVETMIANSIPDQATRDAYNGARAMYPTWKAIQRPTIFNSAAGNLNPRNLGSYLQKNDFSGYALGNNKSALYDAARWGQETRMGNAPPVPVFQFGKWLKYQAVNSPILGAATGAISRAGAPLSPAIKAGLPGISAVSTPEVLAYFEQ